MIALVFSFGVAGAADSGKIPKHIQDAYTAETGKQANVAIWFPVVPEVSSRNWANILIVSNFNDTPISVTCYFTTFSSEQTSKTYSLPFFSKKIVTLGSSGFGDGLYDIYCASDQLFGAAVLLLEGGSIATTWPPLWFF
jgi:hypothetical protein